jgi:acyl carrier protein
MTDTTTEETIVAILSDALAVPAPDLRARPVLGAHGWDSVTSLEALVLIEKQLAVRLDLRQYHATRDIDGLVALVDATRRL